MGLVAAFECRVADDGPRVTWVLDVAKRHGHDPAMTLRVYGHPDSDALARAGAALFAQSAAE